MTGKTSDGKNDRCSGQPLALVSFSLSERRLCCPLYQ